VGIVIAGAAFMRPDQRPWTHGARRLADAAAQQCLRAAERSPDELDLLVNTGVYRERGLGEPALAALIQEDVGANVGELDRGGHGTFSFDVDNGACGVLTGVDLVRGFLTSGAARLGLVVASDSGPGPVQARSFPYAEAGGALLLTDDGREVGFGPVRFATFPEYADLAEGYWNWRRRHVRVRPSHRVAQRLVVRERAGFRERATECAHEVAAALLADAGVAATEVDLLIATPEAGFADPLADRLGIPHSRALHLAEQLNRAHTAQPVGAVELAMRTGRWAQAGTVLFVSAGSGITVAAALYRHEHRRLPG
jgi:3-oxoacyl-[acyl-carrier-protein] synthase-3